VSPVTNTNVDLAALQRALWPAAPGVELILRPRAEGAIATLRRDDAPPRTFEVLDGVVVERHAGDDENLAGRSLVTDRQALAAVLAPLGRDVLAADLVAWRPGRRAVLRLRTPTGRLWLKLLDAKTWRRAHAAFAALGEPMAPLHFARPLLLLPELAAYVCADADGTALRHVLAAETDLTLVSRCVLALGYTPTTGDLPELGFASACAAATAVLRQGMGLRRDLATLATAIVQVPPVQSAERVGFVHGDLHDKQLFCAAGGVTVIDLEGMGRGDTRLDIANLAEHVLLRELQQHGSDSGLADRLLARCGLHPDDAATRAFRAVVRARLCGVYALRPRWSTLVGQLRDGALRLLEQLP